MLDALGSKRQALLALLQKRVDAGNFSPLGLFRRKVDIAQVARLIEKKTEAAKAVREADKALGDVPEGCSARVIDLALHYRNAVLSLNPKSQGSKDAQLLHRARHFLRTHYERGYYFLKDVVQGL